MKSSIVNVLITLGLLISSSSCDNIIVMKESKAKQKALEIKLDSLNHAYDSINEDLMQMMEIWEVLSNSDSLYSDNSNKIISIDPK